MPEKSDLPQGTLDLLILKVVRLARFMDMPLRNVCSRSRKMWSRFLKDRSTPLFIGWSTADSWPPTGRKLKPDARRSSIALRAKAGHNWRRKPRAGSDWPKPLALSWRWRKEGRNEDARNGLVAASVSANANGRTTRQGAAIPPRPTRSRAGRA